MIIGLTGKKLAGKDTVGKHLVDNHGFERIAFADKLKEAVAALFGITVEEVESFKLLEQPDRIPYAEVILQFADQQISFTWREFLQRFGTEMGRRVFGYDFWVDLALPTETYGYYDSKNIVLTDVRFDNESQRVIDLGGHIIEIQRTFKLNDNDTHASEAGIPREHIDYTIINEGTLEELYRDVEQVLEDIRANT